MSTRRDRAAQAIIGIARDRGFAGELTTGELYRQADKLLAEVDRIPDVSELVEASSLGTAAAKAARASVSDVQAQRAIDVADRVRARGSRPDPDSPDDFLCAFMFQSGELCERAAGHSGECTPNGQPLPCWDYRCILGRSHDGYHIPSPQAEPESDCVCVCITHGTKQPCGCPCWRDHKTDDGAVRTGEEDPGPVVTPLDLARHPRTFELYRHRDVTGKSGTGVVAWGAVWPDRTVSLRWAGETQSFSNWDSLDVLVAVHGHEGATEVRLLDWPTDRVCRTCGCTDDAACFGGCYWVAPNLCSQCNPAGGE